METPSEELFEIRRCVRTAKAAKYLDTSPETMRRLRMTGRGPRFRIVNRQALYDLSDLAAFVEAHPLQVRTSEAAA